ncbi:MAG: hypothetical protein WAO12_10350 [Venatoribacter sp.]
MKTLKVIIITAYKTFKFLAYLFLASFVVLCIMIVTESIEETNDLSCDDIRNKINNEQHERLTEEHYFSLAVCDAKKIAEASSDEIYSFIYSKKLNVSEFSKEITSYKGQYQYAKSFIPLMGDSYNSYIEELFYEYIFTEEDVLELINKVTLEALKNLEGVENELALNLANYIEGYSAKKELDHLAVEQYENSVKEVTRLSSLGARKAIAREVLAVVTAHVMLNTAPAIAKKIPMGRMGLKVLSKGTRANFLTLVVGLGIDVAIDIFWSIDQEVEQELNSALNDIEWVMTSAIQEKLNESIKQRIDYWQSWRESNE